MSCNSPPTQAMPALEVTLPLPPSLNSAFGVFAFLERGRPKARKILSEEARRWYRTVAVLLARVPVVPALAAPTAVLQVHLTVYVPTLASDCTNRVKLVEDALVKAGHVHDDRAHVEVHVLKRLDSERPRVEVRLQEAPPEQHAEMVLRLARAAREAEKREAKEARTPPATPPRRGRGQGRTLAHLATPNTRGSKP